MCLAVPARIESIKGEKGTVALEGARAEVLLALVPEARVGDWVLIHAGMGITVIDPEQARETCELLMEVSSYMQGEPPKTSES